MDFKSHNLDYRFLNRKILILGLFFIVFLAGIALGKGFDNFKSIFPDFFKAAVVSNPAVFDDLEVKSNFPDYLSQEELNEIEEIIGTAVEKEIDKNSYQEQRPASDFQDSIDDIIEKIDVLNQKINDLTEQVQEISENMAGEEIIRKQELEKLVYAEDSAEDQEAQEELENKKDEKESQKSEEAEKAGENEKKEEAKQQIRRGSGISYCDKKPEASPARNKVIINEVGWMGTGASSNDEWIELKNISSSSVNLGNWQLLDKESQIKINFGQGDIIPANGFYLLERTDDSSLPEILANFIYTGALNDSDEALYLFDSSCLLQDEVIADPDWPGGDKAEKKSMERGSDLTWHTYSGSGQGTPGAENSLPVDDSPFFEIENNALNITNVSATSRVIINEIQIDSIEGAGGADDDWVELYNPNDFDVSLAGWSIQKHSADQPCSIDKSFYPKSFSLDAVIPAKGFFLIVDTEAQDNLKNIADMTIGWSLSNGNTVYLVKNSDKIDGGSDSDIIDKVGFGLSCFPETNSALEPAEARSIERQSGTDTDNNSIDFYINDSPSPFNSKGKNP